VKEVTASTPCLEPPLWALLERKLLEELSSSVHPYLEKYTRPDGSLIWGGTWAQHGRDDVDDFYEAFYNWPLLYLLGGHDSLLELSHRQWEAVTRQLTDLGLLEREFEKGADFFHQGEGLLYFYFLCLADPENEKLLERAQRFADFYTGTDPQAPNYDPVHHIIRAPHTGSNGPRWGYRDGEAAPDWPEGMRVYGLPFDDVPGVTHFGDLKNPVLAQRLGEVMNVRFGSGDVPANLGITSLVTNAFLMTAKPHYRDWVLEYTSSWLERSEANGGLLPDNVGLSGAVGENHARRWYGGLYGWSWPHGFYNLAQSAAIGGMNAALLSGNANYLKLPRALLDGVYALGEVRDVRSLEMSLEHHWLPLFGLKSGEALRNHGEPLETFVVPYRHNSGGWFDFQPTLSTVPTALWCFSSEVQDGERLEFLRKQGPTLGTHLDADRHKEDAGHEAPWLRFLAGELPEYPQRILSGTLAHVARRVAQIREDTVDLTRVSDAEIHTLVHHWQKLNPVSTEALVQLTLGAPQALYNGGLLFTRVRYLDVDRQRPGLPEDVAALISTLEGQRTVLELINLSARHTRTLIVQAGGFAEHRFGTVRYEVRTTAYPGEVGSYGIPDLETETQTLQVNGPHLQVILPPLHRLKLELETHLNVSTPHYRSPFSSPTHTLEEAPGEAL